VALPYLRDKRSARTKLPESTSQLDEVNFTFADLQAFAVHAGSIDNMKMRSKGRDPIQKFTKRLLRLVTCKF